MKKNHEEHLEPVGEIKDSLEGWLRSYFSLRYIKSAVYFAKKAKEIEKSDNKDPSEEIVDKHHAYVTGSVFANVSFLEATINEILRDSYDMAKRTKIDKETYIPVEVIKKLAKFNDVPKREKFRLSLLSKYQIAFELAEQEKLNENGALYLNIRNFITLRNKLVHYEPTWAKIEPPTEYVSGDQLQEYLYGKFELNPLACKGNPFLFHKCLGYGCCKWGIESSLAFTDEFCERTGIKSKYLNIRPKLKLD